MLENHIKTVDVKAPFCSLLLECLPLSATKICHHQSAVQTMMTKIPFRTVFIPLVLCLEPHKMTHLNEAVSSGLKRTAK